MADLHLDDFTDDFALIPSSVRKEKKFSLPDGFFPNLILLFSHGRAIPRSIFPRFFAFSHRGQTAVRRSVLEMFYTTTAKEEIFNISAQ